MQGKQHFQAKAVLPIANQVGNPYVHASVVPAVGEVLNLGAKHLTPFHGVEFQPSEVCPKNFIIFDQTQYRSQIMFHPTIAHKFNAPSIFATSVEDNFEVNEVDFVGTETSSPLKEDSRDIDALLSFEEDEQDEYDDEEVSTARTNGDYRRTSPASPESFSNYCSKQKKNRSSSMQQASGSGESCNSERKRQKMKKMVNALKGIVPGGNQMNTVAVLDEAVRYLKSLKVEVRKLGVGDLNY